MPASSRASAWVGRNGLLGKVFEVKNLGFYCLLSCLAVFIAFGVLLLLRKKRYPEKSWLNNAVNLMLNPIRWLKLGPYRNGDLSMANALKYAQKKTKLKEWDCLEFAHAYQAILDTETQKQQRYTNLGYIAGRIELNMTMVRRLKFVEYYKNVLAVREVPVLSPVFVMGLPRTGTTLLHRLLSLDTKRCRAPLLWELLAAVPKPTGTPNTALPHSKDSQDHAKDRFDRSEFVRKLINTRKRMGDRALEHIHEVGYDLPEECFLALSDSVPCLLQYLYADYMNPETALPIMKGRMKDAYVWYKKYLQLLSFQIGEIDKPRTWMLKCPVHLFYPTEIAHAFPDAKLIWTHRHPISAVPSMCSLLKSIHQMYYENECRDDRALGQSIFKVSEDLLVEAPNDIKKSKLPCADVVYDTLIKDPLEAVRKIYLQFGWDYTAEYDQKLKAHLEEDRQKRENMKEKKKREGKTKGEVLHTYTPEEFGLTPEGLSSGRYAEYIAAYKIPDFKP